MSEALPEAVRADLRRAATLVARTPEGWSVDGLPAGEGAPALADGLYAGWYTRPATAPPLVAGDPPLHRRRLLAGLRAAAARPSTNPRGWTVIAGDPHGSLLATRGEQLRRLRPGDYVAPGRPGAPAAPGEEVIPAAEPDQLDAESWLWWTWSDPGPEPPFGRLYLNARPATAPRAVHEMAHALAGVAFRLKCPIEAAACERVDAIVVYHAHDQRAEALALLSERWAVLGPLLDPAVPALTCAARPGLAWADDVEAERSYGETRCHAVADAAQAAVADWPKLTSEERVALLVAGLRSAGIDPQCPWTAQS